LIVWWLVVIMLFALVPARRAVLISLVAGWLFLPMGGINFHGLPIFDKLLVTQLSVFLAVCVLDNRRLRSCLPRWFDLPIFVWCLVPLATSLSNNLGLYDGLSESFRQIIVWGLPYWIGRMYFSEPAALRDLGIAVVIGGLIYVPLCLWEVRMSPQLHDQLYGFHQAPFGHQVRFGGYRPMVFLPSGLALGMFMACATVMATWLWAGGVIKQLLSIPFGWLVIALAVTTVAAKSSGAIVFMFVGIGICLITRVHRVRMYMVLLLLIPPAYMGSRQVLGWSGKELLQVTEALIGPERTGSLRTRLDSEQILLARAMKRPILGWGGHGRSLVETTSGKKRVKSDDGTSIKAIPDALWVIATGRHGLVGLFALVSLLLLPGYMLVRRSPAAAWYTPHTAALAGGVLVSALYMCDNLLNAMPNPLFVTVTGGVCGLIGVAQWRTTEPGSSPSAAHRNRPALANVRQTRATRPGQYPQ
jgi:hypothetical protein